VHTKRERKLKKPRPNEKYTKSQDTTAARKAYNRHDDDIAPDDTFIKISLWKAWNS